MSNAAFVAFWGVIFTVLLLLTMNKPGRTEYVPRTMRLQPDRCVIYSTIRRDTIRYYEVQCTGRAVPTWIHDSTKGR